MQVIVPTWLEMSKKARNVNVQRFPGASIGKWRQMLLDHSVSEYFEAILIPQNPASQLKAVRKVMQN